MPEGGYFSSNIGNLFDDILIKSEWKIFSPLTNIFRKKYIFQSKCQKEIMLQEVCKAFTLLVLSTIILKNHLKWTFS